MKRLRLCLYLSGKLLLSLESQGDEPDPTEEPVDEELLLDSEGRGE